MECSFRPRDRDRTAERMEGVWMCFGPLWMDVGLQHKEAFVVPRLTVGVSNGLQMARNLTGGLPVVYQGRLANLSPFQERLTPAHEKRQKGAPGDIGVPDCKTDNGENAWMHETNTYANVMHMTTRYEMQMMTWQNA